MSGVPNVFGSATSSIPLSQLDVNFNTPVTIGNTTVGLGNTVTSFGNVTLTNTTISGLSGGSANGVVYINSSNVAVASPAVLAFDGTNLGLGVTPSASYAGYKTFQIASQGVISADTVSNGALEISNNSYRNSASTPTYINSFAATLYTQYRGEHRWYNAPSGTGAITFTQAMTLNASGNLGIGTTSPGSKLTVSDGTVTAGIQPYTTDGVCYFGTTTNYGLAFLTNNAEKARIDSSGNLLVGQTSTGAANANSFAIQVSTASIVQNHVSGTGSGSGYTSFAYNAGVIGSITQNGTTGVLYNLTSDYRLKNNQEALTGAKDFIMALQPKKWQWWDGSGEGVGFIAHEFMEVAKYSGHGEKDAVDADGKPVYQSIQPSSSEVMANLVSFIQELSAQVTTLQTQVTALKG